jgi:ubiquinone/menaquinone biosynthesis C-methylase UbiE
MNRNQRFFKKASSYYKKFIEAEDSLPWMRMRMIVEPRMGKKVLDVGNGGVRGFNSSQTSLYVGLDFSLEMLKKDENTSIYKVCGEAMNLAFRGGSFDTLFYSYLLHHLAGKDIKGTMQAVKTALCEGLTCLKKEGNVVIIEHCFPTLLERVEKLLYYLIRAFLILTKQSNVFIFSAEALTRTLMESGYREIKVWEIDDKERGQWEFVTAMVGLPFIKIPRWLNPAKTTILEARK